MWIRKGFYKSLATSTKGNTNIYHLYVHSLDYGFETLSRDSSTFVQRFERTVKAVMIHHTVLCSLADFVYNVASLQHLLSLFLLVNRLNVLSHSNIGRGSTNSACIRDQSWSGSNIHHATGKGELGSILLNSLSTLCGNAPMFC